MNITEPEQTKLLMEQPSVPSLIPSLIPIQQPLHFVEDSHLGNARADPDYFSPGRRHYFIDSDFENYNEPGEVLANTNDIFHVFLCVLYL